MSHNFFTHSVPEASTSLSRATRWLRSPPPPRPPRVFSTSAVVVALSPIAASALRASACAAARWRNPSRFPSPLPKVSSRPSRAVHRRRGEPRPRRVQRDSPRAPRGHRRAHQRMVPQPRGGRRRGLRALPRRRQEVRRGVRPRAPPRPPHRGSSSTRAPPTAAKSARPPPSSISTSSSAPARAARRTGAPWRRLRAPPPSPT